MICNLCRKIPTIGDVISLIISKKLQNNKTALTSPVCLSLRDLRNLRENIHARVLNLYCTNETPEVSRWSRRFTQTKPQNHKTALTSPPHQPVFLCEIMQLAAFVCIICVICGRIFTQEDSIYQRKNKQHFICETHINNKEGCALEHPSPVILQSIPCS